MAIFGFIDNFEAGREKISIGGWAYAVEQGRKIPVNAITIGGEALVSVEFFYRMDFEEGQNFAFKIELKTLDSLFALFFGGLDCYAVHGEKKLKLNIWNKLHGKVMALLIKFKSETLDNDSLLDLTNSVIGLMRNKSVATGGDETVNYLIQVGTTNYDQSVIVGRAGHLFLCGGTNGVEKLYSNEANQGLVDKWRRVIKSRSERFAAMKVKFAQVIVPEKQSILHDYYPKPLNTPTSLLRAVSSAIDDSTCVVNVANYFEKLFFDLGIEPYRRVDTHLSFHGARALALKIVESITGRTVDVGSPTLLEKKISGDLGSKFGNGNIFENTLFPILSEWDFANKTVVVCENINPPDGQHNGIIRKWFCEESSIDKKIVIFGNSMFERGGGPFQLSWWFARIFRQTIFYWSSSVDYDVVQREKPDYVVAQTVERFLPGVPVA